ncbi:MAG: hypothetical protein HY364_05575, partial [Candidatus Aenigmarchaeota archaeon]|nr:hypothetical protein [Candidatus Aenigmarchaeota archaeon]
MVTSSGYYCLGNDRYYRLIDGSSVFAKTCAYGCNTATNDCNTIPTTTTTIRSGYGGFCTKDAECTSGLRCEIVDREGGNCVYKSVTTTTMAKGTWGSTCTSDSQCASGLICDEDELICIVGTRSTTTTTMPAADQPPKATIVAPSTADAGKTFTLIGIGTDDKDVFRIEAYYQGSWKTYTCDGTQTSCSTSWSITESTAGTYTYYVYAYDNTGKMATTSKTITVTTPTTPATCTAGYYCSGNERRYRYADCSTIKWQSCSYGCEANACKPYAAATTTTITKGSFGDYCTSDSQCSADLYCQLVDREGGNCVYRVTTTTIKPLTTTTIPKGGLGDACYTDSQCATNYCDLRDGECDFRIPTTTTIPAGSTTSIPAGEPRTLIEGSLAAPTAAKSEGFSLNIEDYNAMKCFYTIVNTAKGTVALNKERTCNSPLAITSSDCPSASKCTVIAKSQSTAGKESVPATMLVNVVAKGSETMTGITTTTTTPTGGAIITLSVGQLFEFEGTPIKITEIMPTRMPWI